MANNEYYLHISIEQPYSSLGFKIYIYSTTEIVGHMYVYTDTIHKSDNKNNIYIKLTDVFKDLGDYNNLTDFLDDFTNQIKNRLGIRYYISIDKCAFKHVVLCYYGKIMQKDIDPIYLE